MPDFSSKLESTTFKEKQKKAEDLLTGLILYQTDLGAIGQDLVELLLATRLNDHPVQQSNRPSKLH